MSQILRNTCDPRQFSIKMQQESRPSAQGDSVTPTRSTQVKEDYTACPRSHRKPVTELGTQPTSQTTDLAPKSRFPLVCEGLPLLS